MDDWSRQPERHFFIGLDLGETRDFAALVVLERIALAEASDESFEVRTLKRWPHGTKYPAIVADVARALKSKLFQHEMTWSSGRVEIESLPRTLVIDRGGVGLPVVELFERALPEGVEMMAVYCHAGRAVTEPQAGYLNIPKRDLVYAAVTAFQTRQLKIAEDIEHAEALKDELQNFRRRISDSGRDTYEAGRGNDDLVFALSLCCWAAGRHSEPGLRLADSEMVAAFRWR